MSKEEVAKTEEKPEETKEETQPKQSWLMWVLSPGIGEGVITFCRFCLILCLIYLTYMSVFHYTIHYVIMSFICGCLIASFEFFISELRKNPEIMNPPNEKPKEEKPKQD
ncbi:hypothetical protein GPJ56_008281 [Histomonas meleagridis]|uniref:uncharacterized protein n=1 Tax=Histomonas meleagridis TaxID=135588 RepID=UPI00355A2285|nr:hypothetical protein GPJ56_008281 [Histomonas meleagridis]KAH0806851.1 hypothetical protein GO595_000027 [Histomonas meleagridis]